VTITCTGMARDLKLNPDSFKEKWPRGTEKAMMYDVATGSCLPVIVGAASPPRSAVYIEGAGYKIYLLS